MQENDRDTKNAKLMPDIKETAENEVCSGYLGNVL
jgi:hypothetical protein